MNDIEMTFESLYVSYVGKNVLNFFRQDHGYQNGTYRKTWGGKEDNEILVEIIERLDPASSSFRTDLYGLMQNEYALLSA